MKIRLWVLLLPAILFFGCASSGPGLVGSVLTTEGKVANGERREMTESSRSAQKSASVSGQKQSPQSKSGASWTDSDYKVTAVTLEPMRDSRQQPASSDWLAQLSESALATSIGIDLSAADYGVLGALEYVASEVLGINLFVDEGLELDKVRLTGTILAKTSVADAIELVMKLLERSGISLRYDNSSLFVTRFDEGGIIPIGIGSGEADVPKGAARVIQVIPVFHSFYMEIDALVPEVANVSIRRSIALNAYIADGPRDQVLRVMQLVSLFDRPLARGRYISIRKAQHMDPAKAAQEVRRLLSAEGVLSDLLTAPLGDVSARQLIFLPIASLNAVVIFSASSELVDRALYWFSLVDQRPELNLGLEFFSYIPTAAKPEDMLDTLTKMFRVASKASSGNDGKSDPISSGQAPASASNGASISPSSKIILDKNSGALLFVGDQSEYQAVFPILRMLDVEPKQIFLDVLIAEISLTGDLRYGLEWALSNRGVKYNTLGGFNAGSIGGFSVALSKDKVLDGRLFGSDSEINVLSSPSLVVREGMDATIRIGSKISVVGETTFDPLAGSVRQTQSASYLDTGVQVTIRPELSGNNVVELNIDQNISNAVTGSSGAAGNPDIFERAVRTSVLASDGQSVLLAGLISERRNQSSQGLPFLSKAPFFGGLFGSQQRQSERTELIILVTPRILGSVSDWSAALDEMKSRLRFEPLELLSD